MKQKTLFSLFLLIILVLTSMDIYQDLHERFEVKHLIIEFVTAILTLVGILFLLKDNQNSRQEANLWKQKNAELINGLSAAIDQQLEEWSLSPSEKEITLLLLKGLSLKEIAEIRSVSERTVRQQSTNIYAKSNLSGRAELAAYFLEDLLK